MDTLEKLANQIVKHFKASGFIALLAFIISAFTALPTMNNLFLLLIQVVLLTISIILARKEGKGEGEI